MPGVARETEQFIWSSFYSLQDTGDLHSLMILPLSVTTGQGFFDSGVWSHRIESVISAVHQGKNKCGNMPHSTEISTP